ncbi:MAG: SPOR domain-containing protein [Ignavibacteriales bacterium]|nr:SPOR domain-containing protein [Ignavibacteriales bacterium]
MNKELLISKIAEILKIKEDENEIAFSLFKDKVANYLKVGEALRISNLGVLQLKEKLQHDLIPNSEKGSKKLTLVFSPESESKSEDSLFINLEIDNSGKDEGEFDENVFQLGIGKPLINASKIENGEYKSSSESIESKIDNLLYKSEKLKEFDLWDDYLQSKETKNILDEETEPSKEFEIPDLKDTMDDVSEHLKEEDFVNLNENEVFDDILDDNKIESTDLKNFDEEFGVELTDEEITFEEEKEISSKVLEEIDDELEKINPEGELLDLENDILDEDNLQKDDTVELKENEEISELNIEMDEDESYLDEIDLELKDEEINEPEIEETEVKIEDPALTELKNEDINIEDEVNQDLEELDIIENQERFNESKKKKNPLLYVLISAFIMVGAIALYYFFLREQPEKFNNVESEVLLTDQNQNDIQDSEGQVEEAQIDGQNDQIAETSQNEEQTAEIKSEVESSKIPSEQVKENVVQKNDNSKNEKEVSKNIYYDGSLYNVQVSSWKQENIAEREVNKLLKKGLPAFIVKIYIPKFDGTWHRVRIGPYNSLADAKAAQQKI